MKNIEQVTAKGEIVLDKDTSLTPKEIEEKLLESLEVTSRGRSQGYSAYVAGSEVVLFVKNITYLGHPHAAYKKRIQVPAAWNTSLQKQNAVLLGIYTYKGNTLYCLFDKKKRGKNSSAHVLSFDLQKAVEFGQFEKIDAQGNKIVVCRSSMLAATLFAYIQNIAVVPEEVSVLSNFASSLPLRWEGVTAYAEMIASNFSQKFQPEWGGFYLEYKFEEYLAQNPIWRTVCSYVRQKKKGQLDFDIYFEKKKFYGDLKMHSEGSSAILGNDSESVYTTLHEAGKLWYVVFLNVSQKDSEHGGLVRAFWIDAMKKDRGIEKEATSYISRMKSSIDLQHMLILEINQYNKKYLSDFEQPKNSDGKPRKVKIQIKKKDIDNFVIHRKVLTS